MAEPIRISVGETLKEFQEWQEVYVYLDEIRHKWKFIENLNSSRLEGKRALDLLQGCIKITETASGNTKPEEVGRIFGNKIDECASYFSGFFCPTPTMEEILSNPNFDTSAKKLGAMVSCLGVSVDSSPNFDHVIGVVEAAIAAKGLNEQVSESLFRRIDEGHKKQQEKFIEQAKEFDVLKDNLNALETIYNTNLAFKSPSSYWRVKSRRHQKSASNWLLAGVATFFLLALILGIEIFLFLILPANDPRPFPRDISGFWASLPVHAIILIGVTSSLGAFALRFIGKRYSSHMHLREEFEQWAVLSQSLLALMRKDVAFSSAEMQVVLSSIFRPASTGVLGDDRLESGTPENIFQRIFRLE